MQVKISKHQLLAQLPKMAGYSLIQELDGMPDHFVFDGIPVFSRESKYPKVVEKLTPIQREIFRALEFDGRITRKMIFSLCRPPTNGIRTMSNLCDVHIKNLRNKLPSSLSIKTVRPLRYHYEEGYYKFIKT